MPDYSKDIYTPEWVDKLYRGVRRNTGESFRFVCLTNYPASSFDEPVDTVRFRMFDTDWRCLMECFRVVGDPVMMLGLDTIITGNLDDILEHRPRLGMIRDPYTPSRLCNGVTMWTDRRDLYEKFLDEGIGDCRMGDYPSEMLWLGKHGNPSDILQAFPGRIKSFKAHVKRDGIGDARIVYFHGREKPHQIEHPILEHWV